MLVDNHVESELRTYEWLEQYQHPGTVHIVTGYFTVGALAYFAELLNEHIDAFHFVLGDIVHPQEQQERPLDLLNENVTIDAALGKSQSLSLMCMPVFHTLTELSSREIHIGRSL